MTEKKSSCNNPKDIAVYFAEQFGIKINSFYMAKTITQCKSLVESGISVEDIEKVIDELKKQGKSLYAFGYVVACAEDVLKSTIQYPKYECPKTEVIKDSNNNTRVQAFGTESIADKYKEQL